MRQNRIRQAFADSGIHSSQVLDEVLQEIIIEVHRSKRISAIKLIRYAVGWDLGDSKRFIDNLAEIPNKDLFNEYLDYIGVERDELSKQSQLQKEFNEELL